jgi:hypothetical protein
MWVILVCLAIPVVLMAVLLIVRSQFGDQVFGIGKFELNREDDYRLIKLRLNSRRPQDKR